MLINEEFFNVDEVFKMNCFYKMLSKAILSIKMAFGESFYNPILPLYLQVFCL